MGRSSLTNMAFLIVYCCLVSTFIANPCIAAATKRAEQRGRRMVSEVDWARIARNALDRTVQTLAVDQTKRARNVILFLGDGMGVSTITAARIYAGQQRGQSYGEETTLAFETFPYVGLSKTYNVDFQVPDSAGTATAYLGGVKTNFGVIGVSQRVRRGNCDDMSEQTIVDSILRSSINTGKRAGVVTTTRITHATPAASYAHSPDRDWESDVHVPSEFRYRSTCRDLAAQLIDNNADINVLLGGGRKHFLPQNVSGSRVDGRDLIQEWIAKQTGKRAAYVADKNSFSKLNADNVDYLLGLFNEDHLKYQLTQRQQNEVDEPTLAEMTDTAIKILRRGDNGYFLLVEGGRIDHAHHDTRAKYALEEVLSLNEAVERAVNLTKLSDTLIVVTADHSHVFTVGGYPSRGNPILGLVDEQGFSAEPTKDGLPYLTLSYANGPGILGRTNLTGVDTQADSFQQPVIVPMNSETHAGEDVPVFAIGPMSQLFTGVNEQNYIAHAMAYASCVRLGSSDGDLTNCFLSSSSGIRMTTMSLVTSCFTVTLTIYRLAMWKC